MSAPVVIASEFINSLEIFEITGDPSTSPGIQAQEGSIAMSKDGGAGKLFIKTSAPNTGWSQTGGSVPATGDPNTIAFFDAGGALDDDTTFTYFEATKFMGIDQSTPICSLHIGPASPGAQVSPSPYTLVLGNPDPAHNIGGGSVIFNGVGGANWLEAANSIVGGESCNIPGGSASFCLGRNSTVTGDNCVAFGFHCTASSQQSFCGGEASTASGQDSFSYGAATVASGFGAFAINQGSLASGRNSFAGGDNGSIVTTALRASGVGSFAFGHVENSSFIHSSGIGSVAFGSLGEFITGLASEVTASGDGSFALGQGVNGSAIRSSGLGSVAMGKVGDTASAAACLISASGNGSFALGVALDAAQMTATGSGSVAMGFVTGTGNINLSSGKASFCMGEQLSATNTYSTALGLGTVNGTYALLAIGRFSSNIGVGDTWVSTEPVFVVGNGANAGAPRNGYQIDKDGVVTTTAGSINQAVRFASGPVVTVDPRTDRVIFVDSSGGAVTVNLPPGVTGKEFFFDDASGTATANPITIVPNGADGIQTGANIVVDNGRTHLIFGPVIGWGVIGK